MDGQNLNENVEVVYSGVDDESKKNDTKALLSMIFGIVAVALSLICCCIPIVNYIAWVTSIGLGTAAVILGAISLKNGTNRKPMAIVGIVLGASFAIIAVVGIVYSIIATALGTGATIIDQIQSYL